MVHPSLYMSSGWKTEKVTKDKNSVQIKLSLAFIVVNVLLWVKFFYTGFILDEFSSPLDWISLVFIVISCLYSLLCPLFLLEGYNWSFSAKLTSILAVVFGITSLVYVFNVHSSDNFSVNSTQVINAKVVSKGTWSKKSSFVLVSSEDVLTYDKVLNLTEVSVGDAVISVSKGELVRTYTDFLGLKIGKHKTGVILNKP